MIQKCVTDPLLWNGFKFHFRMYTILKADMSTYLYCKAFILTAGLKYDSRSDDIQKQITNLSLNKRIQGHPGQIPINMREVYPKVRTKTLLVDFDFPETFCSFVFLFCEQVRKIPSSSTYIQNVDNFEVKFALTTVTVMVAATHYFTIMTIIINIAFVQCSFYFLHY